MYAIVFDKTKPSDVERYQWLYVGLNAGSSSGQAQSPEQVGRGLRLLDKLDELSTPLEGFSWPPYVEEARELKKGKQELRLTTQERDSLVAAVEAAQGKFLLTVAKKYLRPVVELLRDAKTVPADDAEKKGKKRDKA